jgi:hypothetical protein
VLVQRTIFFTCPVDTADSLVSKYEAGGELAEDIGSALIKVAVYSLGVKQEWVTIENVSSTTELRTASGCGASGGESKARGRREGEGKGEGGREGEGEGKMEATTMPGRGRANAASRTCTRLRARRLTCGTLGRPWTALSD